MFCQTIFIQIPEILETAGKYTLQASWTETFLYLILTCFEFCKTYHSLTAQYQGNISKSNAIKDFTYILLLLAWKLSRLIQT